MPGSLPDFYHDFRGGLNTKDQPYLLADGQARDVNNVQATRAGAILKRNGLETFASLAATSNSIYSFEIPSPPLLIVVANGQIYSADTSGALTSRKSGLSAPARWEFVSAPAIGAQGPLYGMNGVDPPQQWDGAAAGTSTWTNASGGVAVPNGKYCLYADNQVFVSGVAAFPSRVYWSAIADPTNWASASATGAGYMDLDPRDGHPITALGQVGPYIIVAKARKLWVILSTTDASSRQLSDSIGCVAHRSMASGPQGTFFLSEDRGVYLTDGTTLTPVSDSIQPTIDGAGALLSQAAAAYYAGHYYLSLPLTSANNDTTLDYDTTLQSWWKHTFGSNQFVVQHDVNGLASLYSAKATAAIIDQCFVAGQLVDNGTPFTWIWKGPWQSPSYTPRMRRVGPSPYYRKRLRQFRCDGEGTIDFSLAKDFASTEALIRANMLGTALVTDTWANPATIWAGAGVWASGGVIRRNRVYSLGVANAFSIVFSATSNTPDAVTSYTIMIADRVDGRA
jgi:hypothetical protein